MARRLAAAAVVLWLAAPLLAAPDFDRDSIRLPALLFTGALFVGAVVVHGLRRGELTLRKDPALAVGLFGLAAAVVSFIAHGAHPSGVAPLGLGLACLCAYVAVAQGIVGRETLVRAGLGTLAAAATLLSAYTLAQASGKDPIAWGPRAVPFATFGNTSEAGCWLAVAGAALLMTAPGLSGAGRWAALASGGLCAAAVWATGSRAGAVAGAVGVVGAAVQMIPSRPARAMSALVVIGAAVLSWPLVASVPSFRTRVDIWRSTWAMARDQAVVGVGPGNFRSQFVPYRDAREFRASHGDQPYLYREVPDAHNAYVHALAESGWIGAAALVLLMYVVGRRWMFFMDHQVDASNRWWVAGAGAGMIAFAVSGLAHTVTQLAAHAALFWYLAGVSEAFGNRRPMVRPVSFGGLLAAVPASALLLLVFCFGLVYRASAAAHLYHAAPRGADPEVREATLKQAADWNHRDWRIRYEIGVSLRRQDRPQDAIAEFEAALREHPTHVPSWIELGAMYAAVPDRRQRSEEAFDRAAALAPDYLMVSYERGVSHYRNGRPREAEPLFREAIVRAPGFGPARLGCGASLWGLGRKGEAVEEFRAARAAGLIVGPILRSLGLPSDAPELREFF